MSRNQLKLLIGHNHFQEHLFTLGPVEGTGLDRYKQAFEMALHVLNELSGTGSIKIEAHGPSFREAR